MSLGKEREGAKSTEVVEVKMEEEDGAVGGTCATQAEGLNTFLLTEVSGAEVRDFLVWLGFSNNNNNRNGIYTFLFCIK